MAEKTKCVGCKVFTMCLGDVRGFLRNGPVEQCYYCGEYYIRETLFPDKTFCEEFHTIGKEFYPDFKKKFHPDEVERVARRGNTALACNTERCQRLAGGEVLLL